MINQEYIMLIMNCKKYINKALYQKSTWLQNLPSYLIYFHVIGDTDLDCEYKFDNDNKILWINVEDDYNSLPKKVIRAYQAVLKEFNFKYLYKTDDDQLLTNINFLQIVYGLLNNNIGKKIHYGGYIVDVKQNHLSQYHKIHPELPPDLPVYKTKYCNGRFYFLSKEALINLISKKEIIEKEYFEDYSIGYNLDEFYKINMINLDSGKFFKDIPLNELKNI